VSSVAFDDRFSAECPRKKLSTAYEICTKGHNHVLRCLIFAFTTSTHLYGASDAYAKQLEAGRDLARLIGGKGKADGVGQLVLGLWYAEKLKGSSREVSPGHHADLAEHHRRENHPNEHAIAKADQQRHIARLSQRKDEVKSIPCNTTD
jgi:hypothetical protein